MLIDTSIYQQAVNDENSTYSDRVFAVWGQVGLWNELDLDKVYYGTLAPTISDPVHDDRFDPYVLSGGPGEYTVYLSAGSSNSYLTKNPISTWWGSGVPGFSFKAYGAGINHVIADSYLDPESGDRAINLIASGDFSIVIGVSWENNFMSAPGGIGYGVVAVKKLLVGTAGNDQLRGVEGNDLLTGNAGNDDINGGMGIDTATYSSRQAAYVIAPHAGGYSIGGPDGTDSLVSIERLQFLDAHLAFDFDGNAAQVYRLYKAAFARTPDLAGLGGWITGMDTGLGLEQVASSFIGSAEFQSLYGASPTDPQFVTLLYVNVLGRAPDEGGYGYWVDELASGRQSRAHVLATFSETAENKAAVAPLIATGILYTDAAQAAGPANGQAFNGTSGANSLIGSVGNDTFNGAAGNDSINGGAGIDMSLYGGNRSTHTVTRSGNGLTVSGGSDGTDTLLNVERLKFADIGLAFDINGNAGQTYRLYQAAFDRIPDTAGLSDWIKGMDTGMTLKNVASGFIGSAEFQSLYGANPTDTQFVNLLYSNVLNRAPDQAGSDYWIGQMQGGMTREMVLIGFSESAENQAALIGVIQDGIAYIAI